MIRGLYSAATALDAATVNQDLVAENLANATTPGYRRHGLIYEAVQSATDSQVPGATLAGTRSAATYTNFDPGPIQHTGNPLDLIASGNVFFVLDGPNGPVYTRNGSFVRNAQGELQSRAGLPVRSNGGRIVIPPNATNISVTLDGAVMADNTELGRLQLAEFADPGVLQRAGTALFQGPQGPPPAPGTYRVEQGYKEGSNVQIVNEMVSMMIGMRQYEAADRAIRSMGEAMALNTRPQG
jgi:flagellar basal body rod protein FlgG